MLDSIFDLIGTPKPHDYNFMSDDNAIVYIKKFKERPRKTLNLPGIEKEGIELLTSIL